MASIAELIAEVRSRAAAMRVAPPAGLASSKAAAQGMDDLAVLFSTLLDKLQEFDALFTRDPPMRDEVLQGVWAEVRALANLGGAT
jgi:hypothetical protein